MKKNQGVGGEEEKIISAEAQLKKKVRKCKTLPVEISGGCYSLEIRCLFKTSKINYGTDNPGSVR